MTTNPLITFSNAPTLLYPPYDTIKAEDVVPGITAVIDELKAELDALEANVQPTWEGCVEPLERIVDRLNRVWGAVSHLKAVKDTKELRDAVDEVQPQRVALSLRLSQSVPLYEAFQTIKSNKATWEALTEAQQRVVDNELRDFVLGGVALQGEEKDMFVANSQELSKLSTTFSNNVLDATKAYKKLVTDKNGMVVVLLWGGYNLHIMVACCTALLHTKTPRPRNRGPATIGTGFGCTAGSTEWPRGCHCRRGTMAADPRHPLLHARPDTLYVCSACARLPCRQYPMHPSTPHRQKPCIA